MREIACDPSMSVCSGCATYLSGCVAHTNSRTANKQTDRQTNRNTNPQSDYNTSPSLSGYKKYLSFFASVWLYCSITKLYHVFWNNWIPHCLLISVNRRSLNTLNCRSLLYKLEIIWALSKKRKYSLVNLLEHYICLSRAIYTTSMQSYCKHKGNITLTNATFGQTLQMNILHKTWHIYANEVSVERAEQILFIY